MALSFSVILNRSTRQYSSNCFPFLKDLTFICLTISDLIHPERKVTMALVIDCKISVSSSFVLKINFIMTAYAFASSPTSSFFSSSVSKNYSSKIIVSLFSIFSKKNKNPKFKKKKKKNYGKKKQKQ